MKHFIPVLLLVVSISYGQTPVCPGSYTQTGLQYFYGNTYWVDINGNDNTGNGSSVSPWTTIQKALEVVEPQKGHLIRIKAGTYDVSKEIFVPEGINIMGDTLINGSPATVLNYIGDGGEYSTLLSLYSATGKAELYNGNQFIKNLQIKGNVDESKRNSSPYDHTGLDRGISTGQRNNILIENCTLENIYYAGIRAIGTEYHLNTSRDYNLYAKNIEITRCKLINSSSDIKHGGYTYSPLYLQTGQGVSSFAITLSNIKNSLVHNNIVINGDTLNEVINNGRGTSLGYGIGTEGGVQRIKIYNNKIHVSNYDLAWGSDQAIRLAFIADSCEICNNYSNQWFSFEGADPRKDSSINLLVYNNSILFSRTNSWKEGIECFTSGAELFDNYLENTNNGFQCYCYVNSGSNIKIHHNAIRNKNRTETRSVGVNVISTTSAKNYKIFNNIFDGLNVGIGLSGNSGATLRNVEISNNIFYNCNVAIQNPAAGVSEVKVSNNLLFSQNGPPVAYPYNDTSFFSVYRNWFIGKPHFTIINSNKFLTRYILENKSLTTDKGIPMGIPYTGSMPDIGIYENSGMTGSKSLFLEGLLKNTRISAGSPVVFRVKDNGGNNIFYQWYKNGNKITGATNSFLEIPNAQNNDAASYYVIVWDETDTLISNEAILSIKTEIQDHFQHKGIRIYPNPAHDQLFILSDKDKGDKKISIMNLLGETQKEMNLTYGNPIDISYLKPGLYILSIDKRIINKFLKI